MGLEIVFAVVFGLGFFAGYQAGPEADTPEKVKIEVVSKTKQATSNPVRKN